MRANSHYSLLLCAEILVRVCIIPVEWEGKFCVSPWWLGLLITQLLVLPATLASSFVLLPPLPVSLSFRHATNLA